MPAYFASYMRDKKYEEFTFKHSPDTNSPAAHSSASANAADYGYDYDSDDKSDYNDLDSDDVFAAPALACFDTETGAFRPPSPLLNTTTASSKSYVAYTRTTWCDTVYHCLMN